MGPGFLTQTLTPGLASWAFLTGQPTSPLPPGPREGSAPVCRPSAPHSLPVPRGRAPTCWASPLLGSRGPGCGSPGGLLTATELGLSRAPLCLLPPHQAGGRSPPPPQPHLSTSALWLGLVTAAMYCMMCLLASVFPAPLSPAGRKDSQTISGCSPLTSSRCPSPLPGAPVTSPSLTDENTGAQGGCEPEPGPWLQGRYLR